MCDKFEEWEGLLIRKVVDLTLMQGMDCDKLEIVVTYLCKENFLGPRSHLPFSLSTTPAAVLRGGVLTPCMMQPLAISYARCSTARRCTDWSARYYQPRSATSGTRHSRGPRSRSQSHVCR